jgi:iron complex outermembrane receptor protein
MAALSAVPAFAQTSPGSAEDKAKPAAVEATDKDDIVVTANRQESLLSKTPGAISAFNNETLRSAGITDARQLDNVVPNIRLTDGIQGTGTGVTVSIRGVSSQTQNPSAAFLLDGIYIANSDVLTGSFFDLERVEVLRGPQGTLYGRNTTAGVVNVISARPKDKFEASADASYGNFNTVITNGMVNVPIGGGLAIRAAVNYDRHDSYVKEGVPGTVRVNPQRTFLSGRLSLGGTTGNLSFVVRGDYSSQKGTLFNQVPTTNFYPGLNVNAIGVDPLYVDLGAERQRTSTQAQIYSNDIDDKTWGVMADATYDFGPIQLTYLGSYRRFEQDLSQNYISSGSPGSAYIHSRGNQNSQEVRLAFGQGSRFHGQIGGYYFRSELVDTQKYGVPGTTRFVLFPGPTTATSVAGFGQATFDITSDLHLTGGIRYTKDKSTHSRQDGLETASGAQIIFDDTLGVSKSSKVTWKAGLDYDARFGLLYATVSTGYKAGGSNDGCLVQSPSCVPLNLVAYGPETLTAYEAGFKIRVIDNTLRFNASAFHYDYSGLQVAQLFSFAGGARNLISNAARAKVDGIETEAVLTPSKDDTFNLAFNYINARYAKYNPVSASQLTRDFSGKPLPLSPKVSVTVGYVHTFRLDNGGRVEASVQSRFSAAYYIQDLTILAFFRQPAYTKTDLSLTYTAPNDRWYVQGFARNVENSINLGSASADPSYQYARFETPRTFGARVGVKF